MGGDIYIDRREGGRHLARGAGERLRQGLVRSGYISEREPRGVATWRGEQGRGSDKG